MTSYHEQRGEQPTYVPVFPEARHGVTGHNQSSRRVVIPVGRRT
jgi:hypothetical protein